MMKDILILAIESATDSCSVSLARNGEHIAHKTARGYNLHASNLTLFIQEVLNSAGVQMQDLSAISVSKGPGSYTGLRIGVSTAKGLCYGLNIPLIAIETLDSLLAGYFKHSPAVSGRLYCPMIDARRMEVYTAFYAEDGKQVETTHALIVDEHSFDDYLNQGKDVVLFGSGADKFEELFQGQSAVHIVKDFYLEACFQDALAYRYFQEKRFEDVAYFEPYYLKDFVATQPKRKPLL